MTLGERLKYYRTKADFTQREVNTKTGINYKTLSNWENDVSKPSPEDLVTLATIYQVSLDYLLGRSPQSDGWQNMALEIDANDNTRNSESKELLENYWQLDDKARDTVKSMIEISLRNKE